MMKRIRKIEIENSRAYYDRIVIQLEKGENLLLYGENGSGKTSLYKSLNDFIRSFYTQVSYTPNRYKQIGDVGEVLLSIGDCDPNTKQFSNLVDYRFGEGVDNTNVQNTGFMKALALSKGFLNYRDLLKVYLYDETNPNLFDFFVLHLLKNHVPLAQGQNVSIEKEWNALNDDIFYVYSSNANKHHRGKNRLTDFERVLRSVLTNLFTEVNRYLNDYFSNFGLIVNYTLQPMTFHYGRGKWEWHIDQNLRLTVSSGNTQVANYTEGLNEARLSAIAICLYLAALKANSGSDLKVMFLDDIFIGIDSANRLPILEILNQEFNDFQIIIATYDRSWYCMAKNYITSHTPESWKFVNLFSLPKTDGGRTFAKPVMTDGNSPFDRAKDYLHGNRDIDLPAAANYFRKTLEEMLLHLPKELFLSNDYTVIPGFKLTQRVDSVKSWFNLLGFDMSNICCVETYLHPLIHPLSHYDEEAQIYRGELIKVEDAIKGLMVQIEEIPNRCKLLYGKGNDLCIRFDTADGSYKSNYFVTLDDNLWLYRDVAGNARLTDCKCRMKYMDGEENGNALRPFIPSKKTWFNYPSLDEALNQIYDYEVNSLHHNVIPCADYDKVFYVKEMRIKTCIQVRRDELLAAM